MSTTLTIDLPDELAARAKSAAGSKPLAEAVLDWIARGSADTPVEHLSDAEVRHAAAARCRPNSRRNFTYCSPTSGRAG